MPSKNSRRLALSNAALKHRRAQPLKLKPLEPKNADARKPEPAAAVDAPSKPSAPPPQLRMLSLKEVIKRTGLSRSTIYKLQSEGKFPQLVKLTERRSAWLEHEIQAHMEQKLAQRDERAKRGAP